MRTSQRGRLARTAALVAAVGAVAPLRLAGEAADEGADWWGGYVLLLAVLSAVPIGLALGYARGRLSRRWAVAAIVLFALVGFLAGWAGLYAGYVAAMLLGLAIAAGDPLAAPDPDDDRLTRPMPRGH